MQIEYVDLKKDLKPEQLNALRQERIDLDDWDYMIWIPMKDVLQCQFRDRLLQGVCQNYWYYSVEVEGIKYAVGIAYHA